jgi:hypothetical protein
MMTRNSKMTVFNKDPNSEEFREWFEKGRDGAMNVDCLSKTAQAGWLRGRAAYREDLTKLKHFIDEPTRSKSELIEMAHNRLGIPKSGLMQMSKPKVCNAIRSAILHEESLSIIAEEAAYSGSTRIN